MTRTVAIVGRPNVGKSTLFNRLVGKKLALVDDTPGVTRDRREGEATLGDLSFSVIDTAGLEVATDDSLEARMRQQTDAAIESADVCLMLIDARDGVRPHDEYFAGLLHKSSKPVILLANKCEGKDAQAGLYEAFGMGLGEPVAISAEHGEGMGDLYEALLPHLDGEDDADEAADLEEDDEAGVTRPLRIAIVGRPNVGKSTLINHLLGEDRLLTGPEAGITRDSIGVEWEWEGKKVKLFDTAGMRRRSRVNQKLEKLSVADTLRAIRFAEVVVVMVDATQPLEKQDLQIAELVVEEGRAVILGVNKWDLVEDSQQTLETIRHKLEIGLPQIKGVSTLLISGLTGRNTKRLMPMAFEAYDIWNKRISTAKLNRWLDEIAHKHTPPAASGRPINLKYMTQAKSRPPTFTVFSSRADALPESYLRYMVNSLRETFDLKGVPIRMFARKPANPYADKKKKRTTKLSGKS